MTLIELLAGMLIFTLVAAIFLAFLFAGFRMGQASQGTEPEIRNELKAQPRPKPLTPAALQEDPYIRALRPPAPKGEVRIPTIEED